MYKRQVQELKNFGLSYDIPTRSEYDNDDMAWLMTQEEVRTIGQYLEEGSADYDQLMSGSYVLVADNNNVEEIYGWRFQVGDQLTFHYFDGTGPAERTVTVLGILNDQYNRDNELLEGWFLLPEAVAQSWVSYDTFNTGLLVNAADGQEAAVEAALEPLVADVYKRQPTSQGIPPPVPGGKLLHHVLDQAPLPLSLIPI